MQKNKLFRRTNPLLALGARIFLRKTRRTNPLLALEARIFLRKTRRINMFCSNCGNQMSENDMFCTACGQPVEAGTGAAAMDAWDVSAQPKSKHTICTVLLSILIVILCTLASVVYILRSVVNENAIESFVDDIDVSKVKVGFIDGSKNDSLTNAVLEYSKELTNAPLTENEVKEILEEDFVRDFVSDKMNDYVDDVLHSTGHGVIEAKEIETLLENNRDDIEDITGYYLTDTDIDNISDRVKKDLRNTELSDYRDDYSSSFALVRSLMSYPFMFIMILLAVVCVVAIALLNSDRITALLCSGICLVITGILDLITGLFISGADSKLNDAVALGNKFWEQLLSPAKTAGIVMGLVLAALGVICIVIYVVICNARKVNENW
jgi:hypothetical protein